MYMLLLISLIPMVLFVLVDYFTRNLRTSILTAIITAVAMGGAMWILMEELDTELTIDLLILVVTMLVTGLISIKFRTPVYFKLQPVITNTLLAAYLAYYQYFDTPLLVKMLPKMRTMIGKLGSLSPEQLELVLDERMLPVYARLTQHTIIWLLIHAALVAWCALKTRNSVWLLVKAIGLPLVVGGALLTERLFYR